MFLAKTRLAGSPLPPGGSSREPRIGLSLMRHLAAHSKSQAVSGNFSKNAKMKDCD